MQHKGEVGRAKDIGPSPYDPENHNLNREEKREEGKSRIR
jgi:hypothetical protein